MLVRTFWMPTMRRDRILIKLVIISFLFAACYLSRYPAPRALDSNLVRNEEVYEMSGGGGNLNVAAIWSKCRQMDALQGSVNSKLRSTIRKIIRSGQQETIVVDSKTAPLNPVAISGAHGTFTDPMIGGYKKVLEDCGYTVEVLSDSNDVLNRIKRTAEPIKASDAAVYHAVFCLRGSCRTQSKFIAPIKVDHIDGLDQALTQLNDLAICPQGDALGVFTCFDRSKNSSVDTDLDTTSWVVTHQGVPTFVTVRSSLLPRFLDELRKAPTMFAKNFSASPFTILQRPVRLSVFVLAVGQSPTLFYLHKDGVTKIGSFLNFTLPQEHETELVWNFGQLQKYLTDYHGPSAGRHFFRNVQTAVANVFQNVSVTRQTSGSCRDCYQILEVTLFVNATLHPTVVTVANHEQRHDLQMPKIILKNTVNLLLDNSSIDADAADVLENYLSSVLSNNDIRSTCSSSEVACITESDVTRLTEAVRFNTKAHKFCFEHIGSSVDGNDILLQKMFEFILPCMNMVDYTELENIVPIHHAVPATRVDLEKGCQPDSAFLSLMAHVGTIPSVKLVPAFHPLTITYDLKLPFNLTSISMEFIPADCDAAIMLPGRTSLPSTRRETFTVGVGENILTVTVAKLAPTGPIGVRPYTFKLYRPSREEIGIRATGSFKKCFWRQTCDLKLYADEPCGLQPESIGSSDSCLNPASNIGQNDRWLIPCQTCDEEASCDWTKAVWSPNLCAVMPEVGSCLQNKKLIFIGDSTNRGIMAYIRQQINGSLWEDEKIHSVRTYHNQNNEGNTTFTFAYYPQFWLPRSQRPSFTKTFHQAVISAGPLQNNSNTIFVVGGLQFMRGLHLRELRKSLERADIQGAGVIIKTLGSGFFVSAHGVNKVTPDALSKLKSINQEIISLSRRLGFDAIDTFAMTTSRYNEFRSGKCSCHFHSVQPNPPVPGVTHKTYTVNGHINALYSQSVLRAICS